MMHCEITTKVLYHDQLGELRRGMAVELPEPLAREFAQRGWVRIYQTKVVISQPQMAAVEPAIQVKRGRPRKS